MSIKDVCNKYAANPLSVSNIKNGKTWNIDGRKTNRKYLESPEYKNMRSETGKRMWQNPEYRKRRSELSKKMWQRPEYREKQLLRLKNLWNNPEYRKKMTEKHFLFEKRKREQKLENNQNLRSEITYKLLEVILGGKKNGQ
jgi:hypothetical protein